MKFALNHNHRFVNYKIAYLAGLLQTTVILICESVNFISILQQETISDVVLNFMGLKVISEFDDAFFYMHSTGSNTKFLYDGGEVVE